MEASEFVNRVIDWIDREERQPRHIRGSQVNGGRADLSTIKYSILHATSEQEQRELIRHWVGTGDLPRYLLDISGK
jgi:hypothetical protein